MADRHACPLLVLAAAVLFSTGGAAIKATSLTGVAGRELPVGHRRARRAGDAAVAPAACPTAPSGSSASSTRRRWCCSSSPTRTRPRPTRSTCRARRRCTSCWPRRSCCASRSRRADVVFMAALALGLGAFFSGPGAARGTAPHPALGNIAALASGLTWAATVMGLRWLGRRSDDPTATATVAGGRKRAGVRADARPGAAGRAPPGRATLAILAFLGVIQIGLAYVCLVDGHPRACRRSKRHCCCCWNPC